MNVQELIEELKKMPQLQPVRIVIADDDGYLKQADLDRVFFEGNHVALEGV